MKNLTIKRRLHFCIAAILLIALLSTAHTRLSAQSRCSASLPLYTGLSCQMTPFTASGEYWFEFDPSADSSTITIVRDTSNHNGYHVTIYSGTCRGLSVEHQWIKYDSDTLTITDVFNYNDCHIMIDGSGGFGICKDIPLELTFSASDDSIWGNIEDCSMSDDTGDPPCPVLKTCVYPADLCYGDTVYLQAGWSIDSSVIAIYDSTVIDIPFNTLGPTHVVYTTQPPSPWIMAGFPGASPPGNPYTACMTVHFTETSYNVHSCASICWEFQVDSVPVFSLHALPDTICPECYGDWDNWVCVHLDSLSFDPADPDISVVIDWGNASLYEQDSCALFMTTGIDTVIVTVTHAYCGTYSDTAFFLVSLLPQILLPDSICAGNSAQLIGSSGCDNAHIVNYEWDFGDGNTLSGAVYDSVLYAWANPGIYIIELEITDTCGNHDFITDTISILELPVPGEITGNRNNCDTTTTCYYIVEPSPYTSYSWYIGDTLYSNSFPQYGDSICVQWNQLWLNTNAGYTWMYVGCYDSISGCYGLDSIKIWQCCTRLDSNFVFDTVITDSSIFTSHSFILNGTITIDADITLNDGFHVLMAPEARIVVNPPYTFTVNQRTIKAGCQHMWDGIYITDSTAKLLIQDSCTIQDAYNSIVSDSGGKFELKDSYFYNNYTSVLVKNYFKAPGTGTLPNHKGLIRNCRFAYQSPGLIAPYTGAKPRFGVYADNVKGLTIGDSTQAGYQNVFCKHFCAIAAFNSDIRVYNNYFGDIKVIGFCTPALGDYINVQCETAIHSVATTSDLYHYNGAQLSCGGGGYNSRNVFDTITGGIYTYKSVSDLRNNQFNRTGTAISLRDFKTGSRVSDNTTQNTTAYSVKAINTVPNGTALQLDIFDNTLTDPTYGIQLLNVVSGTNPSSKTRIFTNHITLNASGTNRYGIRCENSAGAEVYCNDVTRTTLPASAYRLTIRGIQMDHSINALVHDNSLLNLGVGIRGSGSLMGTQFKCNISDGNYNGFYFDAAYQTSNTAIADQGTSVLPNDNKWYNTPASYDNIDAGSGFSMNPRAIWYFRSGNEFNPVLSVLALAGIRDSLVQNPIGSSCSGCGGSVEEGMGNEYSWLSAGGSILTAIINETNDYGDLDESFKYFEKQHIINSALNTQGISNSLTAGFIQGIQNGNIGKIDQIQALIAENKNDSAYLLNSLIDPENIQEESSKWVQAVYLNFIADPNVLPSNIIDDLQDLASASPCIGGEAVYIARAIVDYTEPDIPDQKFMDIATADTSVFQEVTTMRIFPNPAGDFIIVEVVSKQDENLSMSFYNSMGIECGVWQLNAGINDLDIKDLKQGLYLFQAKLSGSILETGRIIISR